MRLRASLAVVVALVLVTVAPQANGAAGTPITTCGQVVTTNAFLTSDMYCPGSDGVVVGTDGITIDLKGFTLRGDRTNGHDGIDDTGAYNRVTVKNGVIRNFVCGVGAGAFPGSNADAFTAADLLVSGNSSSGLCITGDATSIRSVTASANDLGVNISGNDATVKSTNASGNANWGIAVGGDRASIQKSYAGGNGDLGIFVQGNAAVLKGNRAEANGFKGGASDLDRVGIYVWLWTDTPPVGKNIARGNDDPAECNPTYVC
jgi:hypothetical protein